MSGKLIVFEGVDGSGKSTQFERFSARLRSEGITFKRVMFPRYGEQSAALLTMYLQGRFGDKPGDVNAYAASSFYAVDRIASYLDDWGEYYRQGGLLVTDRYTTSNAIHQGAKLTESERAEYFEWLFDYEYRRLALPRPDRVMFFDMPAERSAQLLKKRQDETGMNADIHEVDTEYIKACGETARQAAAFDGWTVVSCTDGGNSLRSEADIAGEVWEAVWPVLQKS